MHRWPRQFQKIFVALLILLPASCAPDLPEAIKQSYQAILSPAPGAPGAGDLYYDELGNGGYDVEHYTLELDIDPVANRVNATATITARATRLLSEFNLDFVGLTIERVTVNGAHAAHRRHGRELTITPAKPLFFASTFTVVITYWGYPAPIRSVLGPEVEIGWFHTADGTIHVVSEPDGAASWFPVNDHPTDKATYRFEITVPQSFTVAASGLLQDEITRDGKLRTIWEMDRPMASYLAAINIGKYELETATSASGIPVRYYFPPGFPERSKRGYTMLPEMIDYFSELFGPYPFAAYGVVIAHPDSDACDQMAAIEIQTLSTHCPGAFAGSPSVVAHELAHQWYGDSVSLEQWSDIWLKEGFATYAQWLWLNRGKGVDAITAIAYIQRQTLALRAPIARPESDDLYTNAIYGGGALVLHALRLHTGEESFFAILRTYYARFRDGDASTEDFVDVAEEVSGQELDDFFQAWLFADEPPPMLPASR